MNVTWNSVVDRLPDSDQTVLIACISGTEPVWLGYHNGEEWLTVEGESVSVTHWADMPDGPGGGQ